jgi:Arc/MetJ-type ribon-helix-helix transcriptional regulator
MIVTCTPSVSDVLRDSVRNLLRRPLLDLGTVREELDYLCELGQAEDERAGKVGDVPRPDTRSSSPLFHQP